MRRSSSDRTSPPIESRPAGAPEEKPPEGGFSVSSVIPACAGMTSVTRLRRSPTGHMLSISTWKPRPSPCRITLSAEAPLPRFPTVSQFGGAGSHRLTASQVVPWSKYSSTRNCLASRKSGHFGQVTDQHQGGIFVGGRTKHKPPAQPGTSAMPCPREAHRAARQGPKLPAATSE